LLPEIQQKSFDLSNLNFVESSPDVSVVIPTYNRLWSLPRAIDSCRNTRCKTEIIVVDDCSTDDSWNWLQTQSDVVSFRHSINWGQTWAINKGTDLAKGKYIKILGSDDFLAPGIIDAQFEIAEKENADMVISRCDGYEEGSGKISINPEAGPWDDFISIQLGRSYGSHIIAMMFRTELLRQVPHRPDYSLRDDRLVMLELGLLNPRISYLPGCGAYWVHHGDQMQGNYHGMKAVVANWQHLNIFKKIIGVLQIRNELNSKRIEAVTGSLWTLAHWIAKTHPKEANEVVRWIYQLKPDFQIPDNGLQGMLFKSLGFKTTEKILRIRRQLLARS
jgi:glycosyltransferase involved in cell wall biosynthesis